jgi:hypothetical protein
MFLGEGLRDIRTDPKYGTDDRHALDTRLLGAQSSPSGIRSMIMIDITEITRYIASLSTSCKQQCMHRYNPTSTLKADRLARRLVVES